MKKLLMVWNEKAAGWEHAANISSNFEGVDFYKDFIIAENNRV